MIKLPDKTLGYERCGLKKDHGDHGAGSDRLKIMIVIKIVIRIMIKIELRVVEFLQCWLRKRRDDGA